MKPKLPARRRLLRWLGIIVAVIIILVYLVVPVAFGYAATLPRQSDVGAPPEGFQAISLMTEDNIELAAWYAAPDNGAGVLLIPGATDSRESVRPYAQMLVDHGFGVLAVDLRGRGESGGNMNAFGWEGTRDVGAAVRYLLEQAEVQSIGGLGLSLGGEVLLGAVSEYPAITAVASDGATHRSFDELYDLPSERPLYRHFVSRVMYLSVQLFSGDRPPTPTILDSITAAEATRLLLIAAGNNSAEVAYNQMFASAVGERATLWVVPGVGHTQAFASVPEAYEQQVMDFFQATLLNTAESGGQPGN
jgi:hypothetical protein